MSKAFGEPGRNWFLPLAAVLIAIVALATRTLPASEWRSLEAALVFDAVVTLPALFWLCYRKRLRGKAMALRLVALMCLGLWLATWLVPAAEQRLLNELAPLRAAGVVLVVLVELVLLIGILRVVFRKDTTVDQLTDRGAPPWIARLMLLEARFWRWLFAKLKW